MCQDKPDNIHTYGGHLCIADLFHFFILCLNQPSLNTLQSNALAMKITDDDIINNLKNSDLSIP